MFGSSDEIYNVIATIADRTLHTSAAAICDVHIRIATVARLGFLLLCTVKIAFHCALGTAFLRGLPFVYKSPTEDASTDQREGVPSLEWIYKKSKS